MYNYILYIYLLYILKEIYRNKQWNVSTKYTFESENLKFKSKRKEGQVWFVSEPFRIFAYNFTNLKLYGTW